MNTSTHSLYEKFARLHWLQHRRRLRGHATDGPMADSTRGQGRILAVLKMQDGVSTKDLSYLLGIRVSSLNELLAKLEKGGYITREPSEADKRVMLVRLTEKGKEERRRDPDADDIFACLSGEEQEHLADYLDRVISALEAELGDEPDDEIERMQVMRERFGDEMFERFAHRMHRRPPFHGHGPCEGNEHGRPGGQGGFGHGPHFDGCHRR